jgi:hypothetical protein
MNKLNKDEKVMAIGYLSEFMTAQDMSEQLPELDLSKSAIYKIIKAEQYVPFSQAKRERQKEYQRQIKNTEEDLKIQALDNYYKYVGAK